MSGNRIGLQGPAPDERPHPGGRRNVRDIRVDPETELEHEPRRAVFSAIVGDEPGVLSHVTGLAAHRWFNIEGLTVGPTTVEDHSRIMVVIEEPEPGINQIEKQLVKPKPVIPAGELDDGAARAKLVLLRVRGEDPDKIHVITEIYDGRTLDAGPKTITIQLTGDERRVGDAVDAFQRFGIIKIARTGRTAFAHSSRKTIPGKESETSGEPTKPNANTR